MFLKLVFCFSEFYFFNSILRILDIKSVFTLKKHKVFVLFNVIYLLFLIFFIKISKFNCFFLFFIPIVLLFVLTLSLFKRQERKFSQSFVVFLDKIAIKMAIGYSFKQSFELLLPETEAFVQQKLTKLYNSVYFSQQNSELYKSTKSRDNYFSYVHDLIHSKTSKLNYLNCLRSNIRKQNKFRHRSGQVCLQYRFQSLFCLGLFIAFSFLSAKLWGLEAVKKVFLPCFLIQVFGFIWLFRIGRTIKWKH